MNKAGVLILVFGLFQAYTFTHMFKIIKPETINYITVCCYCIGLSLISRHEFNKEKNTKTKYWLWNTIFILGGVIVLTYIIDMIFKSISKEADELFGTAKYIWSSIICTIFSLCGYFYQLYCQRKHGQ